MLSRKIVSLLAFTFLNVGTSNVSHAAEKETTIDIDSSNWRIVNDGVMGGLSDGHYQIQDGHLLFTGKISTDNNGGFTSIRHPLNTVSNDVQAIKLRIQGDGNRYQFRISATHGNYSIGYKAEFSTKVDKEQTITLPLKEFIATYHGRIIANAPSIKAENITSIGFLIAPKQEQNFQLTVQSIALLSD